MWKNSLKSLFAKPNSQEDKHCTTFMVNIKCFNISAMNVIIISNNFTIYFYLNKMVNKIWKTKIKKRFYDLTKTLLSWWLKIIFKKYHQAAKKYLTARSTETSSPTVCCIQFWYQMQILVFKWHAKFWFFNIFSFS